MPYSTHTEVLRVESTDGYDSGMVSTITLPNLPSGTVTFLFSDIEGSTSLLKRLGDATYAELLATHRRLMRETFGGFGGPLLHDTARVPRRY